MVVSNKTILISVTDAFLPAIVIPQQLLFCAFGLTFIDMFSDDHNYKHQRAKMSFKCKRKKSTTLSVALVVALELVAALPHPQLSISFERLAYQAVPDL